MERDIKKMYRLDRPCPRNSAGRNILKVPSRDVSNDDTDTIAFAESGCPAELAYRRVLCELKGDGRPQRNLASFVTTRMDSCGELLARASMSKNLINGAEYPHTEAMRRQVVLTIAKLFHSQTSGQSGGCLGTTTVGSSEALLLALIAHKRNWQVRLAQSAVSDDRTRDRPYLVVGSHAHVSFVKFAQYFDVGVKFLPIGPSQYVIDPEQVRTLLMGQYRAMMKSLRAFTISKRATAAA